MIIDVELYYASLKTGHEVTLEELLRKQRAAGITTSVIFPGVTHPKIDNLGLAEATRGCNEVLPSAFINPHEPDGLSLLETLVKEYGFRSLKLMPVHHAFRTVAKTCHPLVAKCRELKIPVTVHSGNFFCYPLEIGVLAGYFPDVTFLMDHMGYRYYVREAIEAARANPNLYLVTTAVMEPWCIQEAVREVGADRVVFGSNAPHVPPQIQAAVIKECDLGEGVERKIFYENAARIYGLDR